MVEILVKALGLWSSNKSQPVRKTGKDCDVLKH